MTTPHSEMKDLENTLDAAWKAAEEALPEFWHIRSLVLSNPYTKPSWEVVAAEGGGRRIVTASGSTPIAALRRLANQSRSVQALDPR